MTTTADQKPATDLVTLTIDGVSVSVPKGTLIIRAAQQVGVQNFSSASSRMPPPRSSSSRSVMPSGASY